MTISFETGQTALKRSLVSFDAETAFWTLTAAAFLLRFAISFVFDLNLMESYGAIMGRYPSLSYLDHPPLTWWLIGGVTRLFGSDAATVVRLPFMLLFIGSSRLLFTMTARAFGEKAGLYAIVAFNLCPLFGLWTGALALTDGPEVFFVLAALSCLTSIFFIARDPGALLWRLWLGAGFFFGCALASKYTAILLLPGLLVFMTTSGPAIKTWLFRPQPYVAAICALMPLTPVLIWNAQHDWASFLFQGSRASPDGVLHWAIAFRWLAMQALYLQPVIALFLVASLLRGLTSPTCPKLRFFCLLAITPLAFFPLVLLTSASALRGFHWGIVGWLMLFPPLGFYLTRLESTRPSLFRGALVTAAATSVIAVSVLVSHAATGWIGRASASLGASAFINNDPILTELFDWTDLPSELKRRAFDPHHTFVTGLRWEACAKAGYILRQDYPFLCLARNNIHFSYIADPARFEGWNAVIVDLSADFDKMNADLGPLFAQIQSIGSVGLFTFDRKVMPLKLYLAKGFKGRFSSSRP